MKKHLLIVFLFTSCIMCAQSIKYDYGVYPPPSPPALPAKGTFFIDPTFGTSILRVTDASDGTANHHSYSYWPCINKNSSLLYVSSVGGNPTLYDLDTTNFTVTNKRPMFASNPPSSGAPSSEDAIWSGTQNNVMLCHTAQKIWSYDVTSNTWTLIKDFSSAYPNLFLSQMSRSINDDVFAFTYKENLNYTSVGWLVYKVSANQTDTANLAGLDEVQVDKTGNYLVIKTGNSGPSMIEVQVRNLQTGNTEYLTDNAPDYSPGHSDNGTGFVIGADNWNNQHNFRTLANPHTHYPVLQYGSDWSQSDHVSLLCDDETWMLVSAYKVNNLSSSGIFENEIFQVAVDGSFSVRRLAHHQSDVQNGNDPYWSSPRATISRDGKYAVFTSNWGSTTRTDVFVLKIPLPSTVSVQELEANEIVVYPNPNDGRFNWRINRFANLKMDELKVYTVYGDCIYSQIPVLSSSRIDLDLHPGIYFLHFTFGNKTVVRKVAVR